MKVTYNDGKMNFLRKQEIQINLDVRISCIKLKDKGSNPKLKNILYIFKCFIK